MHEASSPTVRTPPPSVLTPCQTRALDILQRQGNVFLTGAAGTGKSYLLARYLRGKTPVEFPVVASTGAAAVIVGGRTFHSFFGLGILEGGPAAAIARALRSRKVLLRLERAQCVVIDEVSMLSGMLLQAAETVARRARGVDEPWGGLRIITVGDFAQLPPVTRNGEEKDWAFRHPVWDESDFVPALLSTVVRTRELDFLEILNFVREGIVNERVERFLEERSNVPTSEHLEATRLYPHRAQAEEYNLQRLASIPCPERAFPTHYEGDDRAMESARRTVPIPATLLLKEGALVMMRKNDTAEPQRFVNGSLGHVRHIAEDRLVISLFSGDTVEVTQEKFSVLDGDGNEAAAAWNFPVTLAWAATIHKAQGASLDRMIVDLASLWEPGQAYVALSRVRSAQGLAIARWTASSIRAEPLVTSFYNGLADAAQKYVPRPLFVPSVPISLPKPQAAKKKPAGPRSRAARAQLVHRLALQKASLAVMSRLCGVKQERILRYFEQLAAEGKELSLSYLTDDIAGLEPIRSAFRRHGLAYLKPVFEELAETVPYDTLKLVRCVMAAEEGSAGQT